MADKPHWTKEQIAKALIESKGFQCTAADNLGCNEETIINYKKRYPELVTLINHLKNRQKDHAENMLFKHIDEGDKTCLIFYLKTQCKDRGYTEKSEVDINGGGPLQIKVIHDYPGSKKEGE